MKKGTTRKYRASRIKKFRKANIIGNNIWHFRTHLRMDYKELSEETGISASLLRKWEFGDCVPSVYDMMYLSEYFGIKMNRMCKEVEYDGKN